MPLDSGFIEEFHGTQCTFLVVVSKAIGKSV
jgi:hypothetical protein